MKEHKPTLEPKGDSFRQLYIHGNRSGGKYSGFMELRDEIQGDVLHHFKTEYDLFGNPNVLLTNYPHEECEGIEASECIHLKSMDEQYRDFVEVLKTVTDGDDGIEFDMTTMIDAEMMDDSDRFLIEGRCNAGYSDNERHIIMHPNNSIALGISRNGDISNPRNYRISYICTPAHKGNVDWGIFPYPAMYNKIGKELRTWTNTLKNVRMNIATMASIISLYNATYSDNGLSEGEVFFDRRIKEALERGSDEMGDDVIFKMCNGCGGLRRKLDIIKESVESE